jgi:ribosomal protein S4
VARYEAQRALAAMAAAAAEFSNSSSTSSEDQSGSGALQQQHQQQQQRKQLGKRRRLVRWLAVRSAAVRVLQLFIRAAFFVSLVLAVSMVFEAVISAV